MRRFPFDILFTLLLGLGIGLAYSWLVAPLHIVDAAPTALRSDFKDQYRALIAASFSATNNLPRAESRLALLGDSNVADTLNSQAQRMIASGASGEFTTADQLAALAFALENGFAELPVPTNAPENTPSARTADPTSTLPPSPEDLPLQVTETPETIDLIASATQPVNNNPTPRPTRTLIPTASVPYALLSQETVCDTNFTDGLLQVWIFNSSRRQVPGAGIIIAWDAGEETFFTGLKPEIGNGYADYIMTPNTTYALRLSAGSELVFDLSAPTCQTPSGETFLGGIKLTFQQP